MTDAREPIAVFEGRPWLRFAPTALVLFGVATTALGFAFVDHVPWPTAPEGAAGLIWVALGVALITTTVWARARTGRAELFADRLLVATSPRGLATVFLRELDAFDDRSSELVRIEGRSASVPTGVLFVPTANEADRSTLLAVLIAAGVPRDDGQRVAPCADRAQVAPVAQTHVGPAIGRRGQLVLGAWLVAGVALGALGPCVVAPWLAVFVAVAVLLHDRRGRTIRFDEDRLVLDAPGGRSPARSTIAWVDVVAWRSQTPDEVYLILRPGLVREVHGQPRVPTRPPEVRAAVEAILAGRGVPRL